jgi:hypothetical protein
MLPVINTPNDIIFRFDGVLYDTSTLIRFDTHDPKKPAIFLSQDKKRAFLLTVDAIGNFHVDLLTDPELQSRFRAHAIKDSDA